MRSRTILLLFLIFFGAVSALSQDIPEDSICAECGMKIDTGSRFSALVIDIEDNRKYFCDIGDMLYHYRKYPERIKEANVRDFISGTWIDGRSAYYVRNREFKTPMSWQIGAFKNSLEAERFGKIYTFKEAFELIR